MSHEREREKIFIAVIDAGAPHNLGFWWEGFESGSNSDINENESAADKLITEIKTAYNDKRKIALGLECPLWIPKVNAFTEYTKSRLVDSPKRNGEPLQYFIYPGKKTIVSKKNLPFGSRPWSTSAGSSAALAGLAMTSWFFSRLLKEFINVDPPHICSSPDDWNKSGDILIWEAFVSDAPRANQNTKKDNNQTKSTHNDDAAKAGKAFDRLCNEYLFKNRQGDESEIIPRFFMEIEDGEHKDSFAYVDNDEKMSGDSFISLLDVGLRSAGWPENRIGTDRKRPPMVIRTRKSAPSSASA